MMLRDGRAENGCKQRNVGAKLGSMKRMNKKTTSDRGIRYGKRSSRRDWRRCVVIANMLRVRLQVDIIFLLKITPTVCETIYISN